MESEKMSAMKSSRTGWEKYEERDRAAVFSSAWPCGLLRCTYEEYPRVLYANEEMFRLWGMTEESEQWRGFIRNNIFFMLPFEERGTFRSYLNEAKNRDEPIAVEHGVRNGAGGYTQLIGWIRTAEGRTGEPEYHFMYMTPPESRLSRQQSREEAYQQVLKGAYDFIIKVDSAENTIECVHKRSHVNFQIPRRMRIIMSGIVRQSFLDGVYEGDREAVQAFFRRLIDPQNRIAADELQEMVFRSVREGQMNQYRVVASRLDETVALLCGQDVTEEQTAFMADEDLERLRATQGRIDAIQREHPTQVAYFRLAGGRVYPQSLGRLVYRYCGDTEEEVVRFREEGMPLNAFLERARISAADYQTAFRGGEVLLSEDDGGDGENRLYISKRAVFPGQLDEYTIQILSVSGEQAAPPAAAKPKVTIRTFGYFDVFVDGKPVVFRYEKSKEMLAILVDRKGSFVTNPYFISCLWEDEPYSEKIQGRCRQTAFRMMETLRQYGVEDIIEKVNGRRRIVPEMVNCDYFNHLKGISVSGQGFNGAYMSDYSWGESTLSGLMKAAPL